MSNSQEQLTPSIKTTQGEKKISSDNEPPKKSIGSVFQYISGNSKKMKVILLLLPIVILLVILAFITSLLQNPNTSQPKLPPAITPVPTSSAPTQNPVQDKEDLDEFIIKLDKFTAEPEDGLTHPEIDTSIGI